MPAAASIPPSVTLVPKSFGQQSSGNLAFDHEYLYVKYKGWRRFPLLRVSNFPFGFPDAVNIGDIYCDNQYFYIVVVYENVRQWRKMPIMIIKPLRPIMGDVPVVNIQETKLTTFPRATDNYGRWGMISFNAEYFCIWGQGKWHKTPIVRMPKPQYVTSFVQGKEEVPEFVPDIQAQVL